MCVVATLMCHIQFLETLTQFMCCMLAAFPNPNMKKMLSFVLFSFGFCFLKHCDKN